MSKRKPVVNSQTSSIVLDCSIVMAWYFADEKSDYADAVAHSLATQKAYVPSIWPLEVANTLLVGERRKRSTRVQADGFIERLVNLSITVDEDTSSHAWKSILSMARDQNLSAYDAAYLELPMRRRLPLATLDEKLKAAARSVGLALFPPS